MPLPLNMQSGMPQMNAAFNGWTMPITLKVVTQNIVDGFVEDLVVNRTVQAIWQPLSAEEIALKPDGQRSWEWIDLHVRGNQFAFATNDRIERDGIRYKVMAVKDYRLNNYTEYHLCLDYQE